MIFIPSILSYDTKEIHELAIAYGEFASVIQIDIVGEEINTQTANFDLSFISKSSAMFQYDLMTKDWVQAVSDLYSQNTDSFVIHIDDFGSEDYAKLFEVVCSFDVKFIVCSSIMYGIRKIKEAINVLKPSGKNIGIQVMGIEFVGSSGQKFDDRAIGLIKELKSNFPNTYLQVDGAMNEYTSELVRRAGADAVCVNSAFKNAEDRAFFAKQIEWM